MSKLRRSDIPFAHSGVLDGSLASLFAWFGCSEENGLRIDSGAILTRELVR